MRPGVNKADMMVLSNSGGGCTTAATEQERLERAQVNTLPIEEMNKKILSKIE